MHHKLEIVIPETNDIDGLIEKIMAPFCEHNEDYSNAFWDWYVIGGRFSGAKTERRIGEDTIKAFIKWCKDEGVTVSCVQCGKQALQPEDQIPKVDAKWHEMTGLDGPCLIFQHSEDFIDNDICKVSELPESCSAERVIIGTAEGKAIYMVESSFWNGVSIINSDWDGTVQSAIEEAKKCATGYKDEYREAITPTDEWLVVTVDYHS